MATGSQDTTVRLAVAGDAAALVRLRALMMRHFGWDGVTNPQWIDSCESHVAAGIADGSVVAAVAEHGGEVVATGIADVYRRISSPANPSGMVAHISSMYTLEQHRGSGLARRIVDVIVAELQRRDIAVIELFAVNDDAERLYRRAGFDDRPGGRPMRLARGTG